MAVIIANSKADLMITKKLARMRLTLVWQRWKKYKIFVRRRHLLEPSDLSPLSCVLLMRALSVLLLVYFPAIYHTSSHHPTIIPSTFSSIVTSFHMASRPSQHHQILPHGKNITYNPIATKDQPRSLLGAPRPYHPQNFHPERWLLEHHLIRYLG